MTDQENILVHLEDVFQDLEAGLNGSSGNPMHLLQKKSFEDLKRVQFPDKKHEDWRYTSVQKLIAPKYKLATSIPHYDVREIPDLDSYVIPVMNGKVLIDNIDPRLSELGINLIPLQEALENASWKEIFGEWITTSEPTSNRAFELLNFSFNS